MHTRTLAPLLIALLMLSLSSCYFTSMNPLPNTSKPDKALLGFWQNLPGQGESHKELAYLLFTEHDGFLQIQIIEDHFSSNESYRGFSTEIAGEKYLCLKLVTAKTGQVDLETQKEYYIAHYRINRKQELEITLLNEKTITEAVGKKQLGGQVKKGQYGDLVVITASTEDLAAFFQKQPPARLKDSKLLVKARKVPALGSPLPKKR